MLKAFLPCCYVLSLLLHEIESLVVQTTNEVPIHRSFPCPPKGLISVQPSIETVEGHAEHMSILEFLFLMVYDTCST